MRTTLDIDDDILEAAKAAARRERSSAGAVVSRWARQALLGAPAQAADVRDAGPAKSTGFRPFAPRGVVVTDEAVEALRDAEGL
ncbi:MAG: hypothetical protein HXY24_09715 [Rubrivivax sp.]|nr:hypothetical protein [Rubrivivax sp.]